MGTFSESLSLINVGVLCCVSMDVAPPYWTTLGEIGSGYLIPGFPWWNGSSVTGRFFKVILPGTGLNSYYSLSSIGQVSELELSFLMDCFSVHYIYPMWSNVFFFTRLQLGWPALHRLGELNVLPHLHQAEVKYFIHLFGHQFCPGDAICSPAVLEYDSLYS
jgi:hypothetical protein